MEKFLLQIEVEAEPCETGSMREYFAIDRLNEWLKETFTQYVENQSCPGYDVHAIRAFNEERVLIRRAVKSIKLSQENRLLPIIDKNTGRIHESWYKSSREELLEALEWQGAITRVLLEYEEKDRSYIKELEAKVKTL